MISCILCFTSVLAFIHCLLNNIGTHVDPIIIINRIKKGMEIAGLRDSLVKILQDYSLQVGGLILESEQHLEMILIL